MRCDLHVHSRYSGSVDLPVLRRLSLECYSEPRHVYRAAKARGMDLVTITDHDSIEGALQLAHLKDFIVGEEVTCEMGSGREIHLGVWGLTERLHEGVQARRQDPEALFAWLAENRLPACINHPFSPLTGKRAPTDFHRALQGIALVESQNGMMPTPTNEWARAAARRLALSQVGGSDSHTLRGVGRTFTTVPRARSREDFMDGLRAGFTVPGGSSGSYARLTSDVTRVFAHAVRANARRALHSWVDLARFAASISLLPATPLIPLVTLASYAREKLGGHSNHAAYRTSLLGPAPSTPFLYGVAIEGEQ